MKLSIELTKQQLAIVDHFARAMGMTREEAGHHFLLNDALDWHAKMIVPEKNRHRHSIVEDLLVG